MIERQNLTGDLATAILREIRALVRSFGHAATDTRLSLRFSSFVVSVRCHDCDFELEAEAKSPAEMKDLFERACNYHSLARLGDCKDALRARRRDERRRLSADVWKLINLGHVLLDCASRTVYITMPPQPNTPGDVWLQVAELALSARAEFEGLGFSVRVIER